MAEYDIIKFQYRRSRKGAWIEITSNYQKFKANAVAPARERGLKFTTFLRKCVIYTVAPARERGLKCREFLLPLTRTKSLPQGSVD